MSAPNINLLLLKLMSLVKLQLYGGTSRTHTEDKPANISNVTFVILPFSHKNVKPSDVLQNSSFQHE